MKHDIVCNVVEANRTFFRSTAVLVSLFACAGCTGSETNPGGPSEVGGATGAGGLSTVAAGTSSLGSGGAGTTAIQSATGVGTGGTMVASGGTTSIGTGSGTFASGGKSAGGGATGTGGKGTLATGGKSSGGGSTASGGKSAGGGTTAAGGKSAGGTTAAGGAATGGGGPVTASSEDPGADCTIGAMPAVSSLKANPKLPDPFKKMDGAAMTTKKEWRCRREEILQQGYAFMYGEKPRTPASAVSGTVSTSSISVSVKDGGSATFSAKVTVPTTGKAPYPAVITYSGVAADLTSEMTKKGVAVINYDPYSVGSETNKGTGAFYSVYGKDHAGGLLTAWAWGVSRIIDLLEKNPGTIDPTKIAVTGCSRFGKGALIAGAFDARVALTIPMESGVGGTPALRLIEQLDSYSGSEWPYHAISYEPWFSPAKLGQFTTGNSASADNTDKLPVDVHEMIALVVPRGLFIVDNPSTTYNGLDRNAAYVTGSVAMKLFEALGVKDNITYQGASGSHCQWRTAYTAPLVANIQKFLLGDATAKTGTFATDLGGSKPSPDTYMDFTIPTLSGDL